MLPKLMTLSRFFAESANEPPCGRTYPRRREFEVVRDAEEALEYEENEEMEETPETDRVEERLAASGVGRRFGDGEGDREGTLIKDDSRSVLMAGTNRSVEVCGLRVHKSLSRENGRFECVKIVFGILVKVNS